MMIDEIYLLLVLFDDTKEVENDFTFLILFALIRGEAIQEGLSLGRVSTNLSRQLARIINDGIREVLSG
jgi:hypothetical protein